MQASDCVAEDIKNVKESLQEAQRIARIGSWDWDIAAGKLYWSDESYRLLGLEPSSEPVRTGLHLELMPPEDRERVSEARDRSLKYGDPFDVTYRITTPDGMLKYIHSLGRVRLDGDGRPVYMSGTMQDITERTATDLELRRAKERLEEAQRIAHIGSAEWDAASDTLVWSDEVYRIYGFEPRSVEVKCGMGYTGMDERDRERVSAVWKRAVDEKAPLDETYWITCPDGVRKCVHFRAYPRLDSGGNLIALSGTMQDVTDLKRADEEAVMRMEADARLKVMTEFFTNVSHELKTPLSLILMQMDMMRMHAGDAKRTEKLLSDATLNAYRLTRLVNNLLDISKMDAGFMRLNLMKRDIVGVLRNICDSVAGYASAKSISLGFESDVAEKHMDLDREKLDRIVLNLLSNAIKHTPAGGRISVELKEKNGCVRILVRDTGEGIPADKLGTIFDRFVQVSNRMSRQGEGCGIGLALVRSLVELHGGRVWAESELGRGSVFTVELPAAVSDSLAPSGLIEGFELHRKVMMELSDLYITAGA
jgi:PAS domain S-box-containing protein